MENSNSTESTTSTENKAEKKAPAYQAFVSALSTWAEANGLSVKEQKGYFQFKNIATGHRLVVAKQGKAVTRIDTTLEVLGQPGTRELEVPNGRITCHINADLDTVMRYMEVLATSDAKLRAPARKPKAEQPAAEAQPSA